MHPADPDLHRRSNVQLPGTNRANGSANSILRFRKIGSVTEERVCFA